MATEKVQARLRLATVISLDSRRPRAEAGALMHRKQLVSGQLLAFPLKSPNQRRPRLRRNTFSLLPLLDRIPVPADIGCHFSKRFPVGEYVVNGPHIGEYASDELSGQEPTMIPVTALPPVRTISPMGRGTTPVRFRAEMAKRLRSARIVAGYTTQKQAADAIGIGLDRYEKWETGRTPVPAQYVGQVCELFAIDANYLYAVEARMQRKTA